MNGDLRRCSTRNHFWICVSNQQLKHVVNKCAKRAVTDFAEQREMEGNAEKRSPVGAGYNKEKDFRKKVTAALKKIRAVLPGLSLVKTAPAKTFANLRFYSMKKSDNRRGSGVRILLPMVCRL
jgi:hypothetical protein